MTASIHTIYEAAYEAKDFRTMQFLDWFVKEQAEEETNSSDNLRRWSFSVREQGTLHVDQELGARMYTAPSLVL